MLLNNLFFCSKSVIRRSFGSINRFPCAALNVYKQRYCSCGSTQKSDHSAKNNVIYKPYIPPCYKDHDSKNMKLNRPMSPHLTIYSPTLPAVTSISQRISGILLSVYAVLLAFGALFLPNGIESYVTMIQSLDLSRITIFLLKLLMGIPFGYHYFCGIRFCMWNAGKMLSLKEVYKTGHQCVVAGLVLGFLFALL